MPAGTCFLKIGRGTLALCRNDTEEGNKKRLRTFRNTTRKSLTISCVRDTCRKSTDFDPARRGSSTRTFDGTLWVCR